MKKKFILVNSSILDFDEYKGQYQQLLSELKPEFFEMVTKYGFDLLKIGRQPDFRSRAIFYNKKLDMELTVRFRKKSLPEFV